MQDASYAHSWAQHLEGRGSGTWAEREAVMQAQQRPQLILRKLWCQEALQLSRSGPSMEPGHPLLSHQPWDGNTRGGRHDLDRTVPKGTAS